ncbi:MAG: hypothetical protein RSA29_15080 [Clostridium sp.]|uniref:hypothetical protein n=1 Tax=Clostridium sp. TaxID=1506 RepID=UPI00305EDE8D
MSKKSTKVLSGALATSLMMGAMPVFAADATAPDYDALYAAALTAAQKAETDKTQVAVTAARTAIKPLLDAYKNGETWLESMVGTLSSMVDAVQQNLFNEFYAILYVNGGLKPTLTQAEIDQARGYVDGFKTYEGNTEYITSWSSAVDTFQQAKFDVAFAAVEKAKKSGLKVDVDAAQVLLDEIATSKVESVKAWAKTVQAQLDTAIVDKATPAVVLAEKTLLEADLKAAKELVAELKESDTKILLEARLAKVQLTINGIIASVNAADTEVKLYAAINRAPFIGVDVKNITAYKAAIASDNTTIAGIQDKINLVNSGLTEAAIGTLVETAKTAMTAVTTTPNGSTSVNGVAVKNVVIAQEAVTALPAVLPESVAASKGVTTDYKAKAQVIIEEMKVVIPVMDATNQIQLLAALQNPAFARVNADFIAEYETTKSAKTVVAIQTIIDTKNVAKTTEVVAAAETGLTTDKVNAAQVLVSALKADVEGVTTKADLQKRLDVVKAVIAVKEAKTEATLLTALKSTVLALTDVNEAVIKEYKAIIDDAVKNATVIDKAAVQTIVVNPGNATALTTAVGNVVTNFATYTPATATAEVKAKALAELNRLADVSIVDKAIVDATLITEYMTAIKADLTGSPTITGTDVAKATAVQAIIVNANKAKAVETRLAAVNNATTAAAMADALTKVALNESPAMADYINLSSQAKLEVAELVMVARNAVPTTAKFENTAAVTTAITTGIGARTTFLTNVNAATDISAMKTALTSDVLSGFAKLSADVQVTVAEKVLNKLVELKAQTPKAQFNNVSEVKLAAGL